ncbi:hypothetical protein D1AOALGA4SA_6076 [Olavius algarvensis Delta 1 endosymbiont]|nr:hypothetical protein D1AOALGA4SA_6076 [Olavius algarvensis Delta 1 endosymbiont]
MTNVECRLIRRRRSGIASLSRFKIDRSAKKAHGWRIHYSMFKVGRSMLTVRLRWVRRSSVSFP